MPKVIESLYVGRKKTFDIELDDSLDHQFYLKNGLLTSNSHATSYAICSVQCAHLLTYYPDEWICSYIESAVGDNEKLTKAIAEARSLGYTILHADINESTDEWSVAAERCLSPSLLSIKGVGAAAISEILCERPYVRAHDLLWKPDGSWRHSKFNKLALGALIKARAFDSMCIVGNEKMFSNYRHMYETIINNWNILKKKNAHIGFQALVDSAHCDDWSREEIISMSMELFGDIDISTIVDKHVIDNIEARGAMSIDSDDVKNVERSLVWFFVGDVIKKRSKNGKPYIVIDAIGASSNHVRLFCWSVNESTTINRFSLCIADVNNDDFGMSTTRFKIREIDA